VRTVVPGGAFYVFPDVSGHLKRGPDGVIASANDLGSYLLRHASVATVPQFGAPRHPAVLRGAAPGPRGGHHANP
jgi:aspartate/methionine/tyrosine aminotransferase